MSSATEAAYQFIRSRIISGEYGSGDALATKRLAEVIGVSRTPIRDALRQLEAEGLVQINPRHEARVKRADLNSIRDIWELRIALETHAAALAAKRHRAEDIERIERPLVIAKEALKAFTPTTNERSKRNNHLKFAESDVQFHLAIAEASGNHLIKNELNRIRVIHDVVLPSSSKIMKPHQVRPKQDYHRILRNHRTILDSIRQRDEMKAFVAMKEHLSEPMQRIQRVLGEEADAPAA